MRLDEMFRQAVETLMARGVLFAVAGGFAADLYRSEHRLTQDVDLCIAVPEDPEGMASGVLMSLGLKPGIAREADLAGGPLFAIRRKNTRPCMVIGRPEGMARGPGVDILLPAMPWVPRAVTRAQHNLVDFGFGPVPVITREDVIVAKLAAMKGTPSRFKDLDDLVSIFGTNPDLDIKYLAGRMHELEVVVPKAISDDAPEILVRVSKDINKELRRRMGLRRR